MRKKNAALHGMSRIGRGFVDSKLAGADGKTVSTAFYATQLVHEVDEADASAVRGFYALDSDDVKKYHGKDFGKRLKDASSKHFDATCTRLLLVVVHMLFLFRGWRRGKEQWQDEHSIGSKCQTVYGACCKP